MAIGHKLKDGWHPLTNDPTWPAREADASGSRLPPIASATGEIPADLAGLCPKIETPFVTIPDGDEDCE